MDVAALIKRAVAPAQPKPASNTAQVSWGAPAAPKAPAAVPTMKPLGQKPLSAPAAPAAPAALAPKPAFPNWAKPEYQDANKYQYLPWDDGQPGGVPGMEGGRIVNRETGVIAQAEIPNREAWLKRTLNQPPAASAPVAPAQPVPAQPAAPAAQATLPVPVAQAPAAPAPVVPAPQQQPQPQPSPAQPAPSSSNTAQVSWGDEPAQPKGPEAFVDNVKARSEGAASQSRVIDMTKPLDVDAISSHMKNPDLSPEERQQVGTDVAQHVVQNNPLLYEGYEDVKAGNTTTEAAKAYQGELQKKQDEFVQQRLAANPAASPQQQGGIIRDAISQFQGMHPALQALVGIGLPLGLVGIMSSMFGEGGMGMGILGALGLGAGVLGGAAGGMFGQGAQNMAADGLFNAGQFLGMIPEGKHDLSMLTADDPIAAIKAKGGGGGVSPAAVKEQLAKAEQQKQQLGMLMSLPEGMRPRMLQHLSNTNMTDEQAALAARNAAMLHGHLNDPKSELSQLQQQGQRYVEAPVYTALTEILPQKAYEAAQGAYDYTLGNSNMPWNRGKKSADMRINKLIEKWAFNAMDAKELSDLKAEKAKGAPYRVDDARRAHTLALRQQASPPRTKKTIVVLCMKSARCWAGYEPVPGKKPYSNNSCRPIKSKKKPAAKKAK